MDVPLNLYNRKDTDCNINVFFSTVARDRAAISAGDTVGNPAARYAGFPALADFSGKAYWFCDLDACLRQVPDRGVLHIRIVHREVRAEYLDVALAAVKDNLLIEDTEPLHTHWHSCWLHEYVELYIKEERHIHRVKALMERNRLQVDIYGDNIHVSDSNVARLVYHALCRIAKQYL